MKVIVAENYAAQCAAGADIIEKLVREQPDCRLGLATGSSPVGMYQELARRCREEGLDFSKVSSVNLDEYIGLEPTHDQSYRYFMDTNLFDHINIDKANTYVAKGTGDIDANIEEFRRVIAEREVALQVLGVGPDGHLAFNEPGEKLWWHAHKEVLDESTIDANARFFASRDEVPRYAVTMGMGEIMMAKRRKQGRRRAQTAYERRDLHRLPRNAYEAASGRNRHHRQRSCRYHRLQGLSLPVTQIIKQTVSGGLFFS